MIETKQASTWDFGNGATKAIRADMARVWPQAMPCVAQITRIRQGKMQVSPSSQRVSDS